MRHIGVTKEETEVLQKLLLKSSNSVVRQRCLCLLMSSNKLTVKQICAITNLCRQTIYTLFFRWETTETEKKVSILSIAPGRGAKIKLQPISDILPELVEKHSRNLKPMLEKLEKEHGIKVCKKTLYAFLKALGFGWKRIRLCLKNKRDQAQFDIQHAELEQLKELHRKGHIDLCYCDESHFGLTPNVSSAWQHKNRPIRVPAAKGQSMSVFGIMNLNCDLSASWTVEGSVNTDIVTGFLDEFVAKIKKKTVLVIDNAPIHRSKKFMEKISYWSRRNLLIYFLPPYSPELNLIETLWRFIKHQWLPFDAFLSFQHLKERLGETLSQIGSKCQIKFC